MLKKVLEQNHWVGKVNLKDAYLTVQIHHSHMGYLRFFWKGKAYKFVCLPFGLASVPRTFTKILKPVTNFLKSQGVKMVVYIDGNSRQKRKSQATVMTSEFNPNSSRVCSKYQEVHIRAT